MDETKEQLELAVKNQIAFAAAQLATLQTDMKMSPRQVKATLGSAQEALRQAQLAVNALGKK